MKIYKHIWFLAFIALATILLSSCSDDDNGGGQPVIESVRVTDPALADSTFTQAVPGKMIVIQGRNLGGCRELYINDQKVAFNPNMNTSHSIITTIPTEEDGNFKLTAFHPELASEIRVVTPGGVATFAFKVLAPKPAIDRIAGDYPRKAGDRLSVFGQNFLDIERAYFTDVNPQKPSTALDPEPQSGAVEVDVTDYDLSQRRYLDEKTKKYVTDSEMKLTLPDLPFSNGFFVIVTPQGRSVVDFAALPLPPVMSALSSDMPIPGTRVTITGANFIAVEGVKFGNAIAIPAEDIEVAESERELSFIMPAKPAQTTTISVVTAGGTTNEFRFYPYETLLLDFDNLGKDCNWGANVPYPVATPDAEPYISDGKFAKFDVSLSSWNYDGPELRWDSKSGSTYELPGFDVIPADTPLSKVYLKYEVYNKYVFTKEMRYTLRDGAGKDHAWINYDANKKHIIPEYQDQFGNQKYGEWYTAVLALNNFPDMENLTYGDLVELGIKRILLKLYNRTGSVETVFTCIDNLRISTLETYNPE